MKSNPEESLHKDSRSPEDLLSPETRAKKMKKLGSNRGVETMFRNACRVHVELSAIADSKANFLISVNSIILILAAAHGKEVVTDKLLLFPAVIVIGSCVGSMVYAAIVARPRVTRVREKGERKLNDEEDPNLLFFGGFTKIQKEEYVESMSDLILRPEAIYPTMAADIYDMGKVLERKFERLQTAYGYLLYGLPIGLVLFLTIQTILKLIEKGVV
ncbi:MAG: hypothetical protein CMO47_04680 [Verrucomicrobiales bacterium]|nr:hypothetical protein [Verrucomicrobiales bacterium]|tara:strand:+ start:2269 stop:2916 length:648 start_codon:yes stop_codon:yes gene_type:complete